MRKLIVGIGTFIGTILGKVLVWKRDLFADENESEQTEKEIMAGYIPKKYSWYVTHNMDKIKVWKDRAKIVHAKGSDNYGLRYCLVTPEFGTLWLKSNGVTRIEGVQDFLKECWEKNKKYLELEMVPESNKYDENAVKLKVRRKV